MIKNRQSDFLMMVSTLNSFCLKLIHNHYYGMMFYLGFGFGLIGRLDLDDHADEGDVSRDILVVPHVRRFVQRHWHRTRRWHPRQNGIRIYRHFTLNGFTCYSLLDATIISSAFKTYNM